MTSLGERPKRGDLITYGDSRQVAIVLDEYDPPGFSGIQYTIHVLHSSGVTRTIDVYRGDGGVTRIIRRR
jgi:hypothetical protein